MYIGVIMSDQPGSTSRSSACAVELRSLGMLLSCAVAVMLAGCETAPGPLPVGPGAATQTDIAPWLGEAEIVDYVGTIENILVASQRGAYVTWSLAPAGPHVGCEVDTRPCPADAERMRGRRVRVRGKLIERPYPHLPLLVAERIEAHDGSPATPLQPTAPPPAPFTIAAAAKGGS